MKTALVADVGNSRIKCKLFHGRDSAVAALPLDDPQAWLRQCTEWNLPSDSTWTIAGVNPPKRDTFVCWLRQQRATVHLLDSYKQLPVQVNVEQPRQVGIDRLLNAVAALNRNETRSATIVDAGSAVTVDYVLAGAGFQGGVILPGFRLMARALNDYTALLPRAGVPMQPVTLGQNTEQAIQGGIYWSILGAVTTLLKKHRQASAAPVDVFLTGGDGQLLLSGLQTEGVDFNHWPDMTLEGIRLSGEFMRT